MSTLRPASRRPAAPPGTYPLVVRSAAPPGGRAGAPVGDRATVIERLYFSTPRGRSPRDAGRTPPGRPPPGAGGARPSGGSACATVRAKRAPRGPPGAEAASTWYLILGTGVVSSITAPSPLFPILASLPRSLRHRAAPAAQDPAAAEQRPLLPLLPWPRRRWARAGERASCRSHAGGPSEEHRVPVWRCGARGLGARPLLDAPWRP